MHCLAYEYRSRNIHHTCGLDSMSPADGDRFGSDTAPKLCCYIQLDSIRITYVGRDGLWWSAFSGHGMSCIRCCTLLISVNVYEMINTRNSLIAYIIIHKFIISSVCA